MPTYDYRCNACGHTFEHFQSMKDKPLRTCPACKKPKLERLIGTGAAILFKGGGFYQTDYRSESYRQAAKADAPASDASPSGQSKEPPKPEGKTQSAPAAQTKAQPATKVTSNAPTKPEARPEAKAGAKSTSRASATTDRPRRAGRKD